MNSVFALALRRSFRIVVRFSVAALVAVALRPSDAEAIFACTAAEVVARDPGCPSTTAPCRITRDFELGDACILDFGARTVTLEAAMRIGQGSVSLRAGQFVVSPTGLIEGGGDLGGSFDIEVSGDMRVERSTRGRGFIMLSGTSLGGVLQIAVGGSMRVDGEIRVDAGGGSGEGGEMSISAGGEIVAGSAAVVSAQGDRLGGSGGVIGLAAEGLIDVQSTLDVGASSAGAITIESDERVILRDIKAASLGNAGEGGEVEVAAPTVELRGFVDVRGHGPVDESGGDGGTVTISASYGDLTVAGRIDASGGGPDGGGGVIQLESRGKIEIRSGSGRVHADAGGSFGFGGEVDLLAGLDITVRGPVTAVGGEDGGDLSVRAGRSMQVYDRVSAKGNGLESFGGLVSLVASEDGSGILSVNSTGLVDAGGGGCTFDGFCGAGGELEVLGCEVNIASGGRVVAQAGEGGAIDLTARDDLFIDGTVDASGTTLGVDGSVTLTFRNDQTPAISKPVIPMPGLIRRPACTSAGQSGCLVPCPVCGNQSVEFPETCDDGSPPRGCDGCSILCKVEVCGDGNPCTRDECQSELGCRNVPDPTLCSPTPTRTRTPTRTPTRTGGTSSPSPGASRTPTATKTATGTPAFGGPGDANCDGRINTADLAALVERLYDDGCIGADVNEDGNVTAADLAALVILLDS